MIAVVLLIGNNKKIMKEFTNSRLFQYFGICYLILMTTAAIS
jgi:Mn2+/Fe2+ NRAMP family transporter